MFVRTKKIATLKWRLVRLARLCFSQDFRTRDRYYRNKMRMGSDAFLRLAATGERNPAYDEPGADLETVHRYTPVTEATYALECALTDAGLTLDFLKYCVNHSYKEGHREAGILLEKEMETLAQCVTNAKALNIPLKPYAAKHPWAELNLAL